MVSLCGFHCGPSSLGVAATIAAFHHQGDFFRRDAFDQLFQLFGHESNRARDVFDLGATLNAIQFCRHDAIPFRKKLRAKESTTARTQTQNHFGIIPPARNQLMDERSLRRYDLVWGWIMRRIEHLQAEIVAKSVGPMPRCLWRLQSRMEKSGYTQNELYRIVRKAYYAVYHSNVELHYLTVEKGVGRKEDQP